MLIAPLSLYVCLWEIVLFGASYICNSVLGASIAPLSLVKYGMARADCMYLGISLLRQNAPCMRLVCS